MKVNRLIVSWNIRTKPETAYLKAFYLRVLPTL